MLNSEIPLQLSLAAFPGRRHQDAVRIAVSQAHFEPFLGQLHSDHLQLVPQCLGVLDEDLCDSLMQAYPGCSTQASRQCPVDAETRQSRSLGFRSPCRLVQASRPGQQEAQRERVHGSRGVQERSIDRPGHRGNTASRRSLRPPGRDRGALPRFARQLSRVDVGRVSDRLRVWCPVCARSEPSEHRRRHLQERRAKSCSRDARLRTLHRDPRELERRNA